MPEDEPKEPRVFCAFVEPKQDEVVGVRPNHNCILKVLLGDNSKGCVASYGPVVRKGGFNSSYNPDLASRCPLFAEDGPGAKDYLKLRLDKLLIYVVP